ncbi:hypothetical protein B0H21DRAFT_691522 [Amylocystis lapponica]|nr:hypothetical protein B0H21DRAFT_691522 [Amylocystis lapponica]
MPSSGKSLRSRLAPSLPGSLRASAKFFSSSGSSDIQFTGRGCDSKSAPAPVVEQRLCTAESCFDDFEQISYDELRASLFLGDSFDFDSQASSNSSLLSRSRSTLSRLRKVSRRSLTKTRGALEHKSTKQSISVPEETALILAFPNRPSTETPRPDVSRTATTPVDDSSSVFYDRDPFRRVESPIEEHSGESALPLQIVTESDQADVSTSTRPFNQGVFSRKSLKRIKTFTRTTFFPSRRSAPEVCRILQSEPTNHKPHLLGASNSPNTSSQVDIGFLPELSFDQLDLSTLFPKDKPWRFSRISRRDRDSFCEFLQLSKPDVSDCIPHLQLVRYERVDPHDLTASPSTSTIAGFSPAATPLSLHSPSWLSRNIRDFLTAEPDSPCLPIPPPASPPLPILPRSLLPASSSVTLCTTSRRVSSRRSSVYSSSRPRPRSSNRLSVIHYRRSFVDSRKSIQSFIAYGSIAYSTEEDLGHDRFPLPNYLLAIAKSILRNSQALATMPLDVYGKPADTVDWGDEVDYSGYEWFKDPPPRPEPTAPSTTDAYVPQAGVIEQNEMFDFALKSAPNVLYARFKQYGQLGVLAWCSEFSEMIDSLKTLGFEGNMFVSTRTQALRTCEEILRLKLKVEMQIIVMYLSSQVARLRRFLDADRQWDDYPELTFPLDYRQYQ